MEEDEEGKRKEEKEDKVEVDSMLGTVQLSIEFLKKVVDEVGKAKREITKLRADVRKQGVTIASLQTELNSCKQENKQLKEAVAKNREQVEVLHGKWDSKALGQQQQQQRTIFQVPKQRAATTNNPNINNNINNRRRSLERKEVSRSRSESRVGERERVVIDQRLGRERQVEIDRSKNLVIWGLDKQLNIETAVREVINILEVREVEVVKSNNLRTREGKLLVIILQLKKLQW